MIYRIEIFNKWCPPDDYDFKTEKEARKFLKLELQKSPKRGWELSRVEILDGSNY